MDDFDRFERRAFYGVAIFGVLWLLFWAGAIITVLVLLWRNFA